MNMTTANETRTVDCQIKAWGDWTLN